MADVTETCANNQDVIAQYQKEQEEKRKAALAPEFPPPVELSLLLAQVRAESC